MAEKNETGEGVGRFAEIELKYLVSCPQALATLMQSKQLRKMTSEAPVHTPPVSVYYDTAGDNAETAYRLFHEGTTLRVRFNADGSDADIAVKTEGYKSPYGTTIREEFEFRMDAPRLDLDMLASERARGLVSTVPASKLQPIFATEVQRACVTVETQIDGKKAVVEIAFDDCLYRAHQNVAAGRQGPEIHHTYEVEFEFKQKASDPSLTYDQATRAVEKVASALQGAGVDMKLNHYSKARLGFDRMRQVGNKLFTPAGAPVTNWQNRRPLVQNGPFAQPRIPA